MQYNSESNLGISMGNLLTKPDMNASLSTSLKAEELALLIDEVITELHNFLLLRRDVDQLIDTTNNKVIDKFVSERIFIYNISQAFKEIIQREDLNSLVDKNSGVPWKQIAGLYDALYNNLPEAKSIGGRDIHGTLYYDENFRDEALDRITNQDMLELISCLESIRDFPGVFRQRIPIANHIRKASDFYTDEINLQIIEQSFQALSEFEEHKELGLFNELDSIMPGVEKNYALRFIISIGEAWHKLSDNMRERFDKEQVSVFKKIKETRDYLCHPERQEPKDRIFINLGGDARIKFLVKIRFIQKDVYGYEESGPKSKIDSIKHSIDYEPSNNTNALRYMLRSGDFLLRYTGGPINEYIGQDFLSSAFQFIPVGRPNVRREFVGNEEYSLSATPKPAKDILDSAKEYVQIHSDKILKEANKEWFDIIQIIAIARHNSDLEDGLLEQENKLQKSLIESKNVELLLFYLQQNLLHYETLANNQPLNQGQTGFINSFCEIWYRTSRKCKQSKKKNEIEAYIKIFKPTHQSGKQTYSDILKRGDFKKDFSFLRERLSKDFDESQKINRSTQRPNKDPLEVLDLFEEKLLHSILNVEVQNFLKILFLELSGTWDMKTANINNIGLIFEPIRELHQIQAGAIARFILENSSFTKHMDDETRSLLYAFLQVQRGSLAHNHQNNDDYIKLEKMIKHHIEEISKQSRILGTALETIEPGECGQVYLDDSLKYHAAIEYAFTFLSSRNFFHIMHRKIIEQDHRKNMEPVLKEIRTSWKSYIEKQREDRVTDRLQNLSISA